MKKVFVLGTVLSSLLFIGACKSNDKEVVPAVVTQQLYPSPTVKIGFSVHVLASSESARTAGLDGATVVVKQNGNNYTATTDESGIATFGGLTEGTVRWYVKKADFASVNGTTTLTYGGTPVVDGANGTTTSGNSVTVNNEQTYSVTSQVTLPKVGASVSGVLMADFDGSAGSGNVVVVPTGTIVLKISDSFEPNTFTTTVSGGVYSFTGLPEGVAFTLSTQDIKATIAATSTTPQYTTNLNFGGASDDGTTPMVGKTLLRGLVTLQ
jgi:hypothetical protein